MLNPSVHDQMGSCVDLGHSVLWKWTKVVGSVYVELFSLGIEFSDNEGYNQSIPIEVPTSDFIPC